MLAAAVGLQTELHRLWRLVLRPGWVEESSDQSVFPGVCISIGFSARLGLDATWLVRQSVDWHLPKGIIFSRVTSLVERLVVLHTEGSRAFYHLR